MLKIKNIWYKIFFKNISLNITNWIVLIFWPSGSWKTTFLKIIWWYIPKHNWDIFLNWENIKNNIINYRKKNWFSFQNENLLDLDVKTNLNMSFIFSKEKKNIDWQTYLLNYFEISHLIDKNIENISWWEKQRVSIVKSFISKPKIVFLDESDTSLDDYLKNKFYKFILEYSKNNIIFLISHNEKTKNILNIKKNIYDWFFSIFK